MMILMDVVREQCEIIQLVTYVTSKSPFLVRTAVRRVRAPGSCAVVVSSGQLCGWGEAGRCVRGEVRLQVGGRAAAEDQDVDVLADVVRVITVNF
jgi:hypothetical protein